MEAWTRRQCRSLSHHSREERERKKNSWQDSSSWQQHQCLARLWEVHPTAKTFSGGEGRNTWLTPCRQYTDSDLLCAVHWDPQNYLFVCLNVCRNLFVLLDGRNFRTVMKITIQRLLKILFCLTNMAVKNSRCHSVCSVCDTVTPVIHFARKSY